MKLNFSQFIAITALSVSASASFADDSQRFIFPLANTNHTIQLANASIYQILLNSYAIKNNKRKINKNKRKINKLDERVATLESAPPTDNEVEIPIILAIDCSTGESIAEAINNVPASGQLNVNISGDCTETLIITRDNTSLIGDDLGASISYDTEIIDNQYRPSITSVVTVIGATNVVIDNLTLGGATTNGTSSSLRLFNNASVLLTNSTLDNSVNGVYATNLSSIQMSDSNVENNSSFGLLITDSANADIRENNSISHSASLEAAVGVYRNSSVRVQGGGNSISNTFANGDAVEAFHGSQFRSDNGRLEIFGNAQAGLTSQVELRNTLVVGNLNVTPKGVARLRAKNDNVTITGNVTVTATGHVQMDNSPNNTVIEGDVICFSNLNAIVFAAINQPGSATVNGIFDPLGNCNQ